MENEKISPPTWFGNESRGLSKSHYICTIDKLMPDTVAFLEHQEKARCACLEVHGEAFYEKMEESIAFMKEMPQKYELNNLSP